MRFGIFTAMVAENGRRGKKTTGLRGDRMGCCCLERWRAG
jgi:hypothetical protein